MSKITGCRGCGGTELEKLFSLGEQYVSDFIAKDNIYSGPKVPITLVMCRDCQLVQQLHSAPLPTKYWYRSGITKTMRDALADVAKAAQECMDLQPGDVVLDIGSNDGTLLKCYDKELIRIGVEPSQLVMENMRDVDLLVRDFWGKDSCLDAYFGEDTSKLSQDIGKAKVVTAIGMAYDLEDPRKFFDHIAKVLHPEGICVLQLMMLQDMLDVGDIGNACHEHLEFYSYSVLENLLRQVGLRIWGLERNTVNGKSGRLYVRQERFTKLGSTTKERELRTIHDWRVIRTRPSGLKEDPTSIKDNIAKFFADACRKRDQCVDVIRGMVADGKKVWALGASTKGSTILQWYGLDSSVLSGASERSPEKHGLYTAGTGIRITSEEGARAAIPDAMLVLPYTFRSEIMERERDQEWRKRGGKFIFPLPSVEVL